jgi:CRISPR-associated endoribonuclease Cas6
MPMALVMTLRPLGAVPVPDATGRMLHAMVLRWIQERDPGLASSLHDESAVRPLAVTLLPTRQATSYGAPEPLLVRVVGLQPALEALLASWTPDMLGQPMIAGVAWQIAAIAQTPAAHPLAGQVSYAELLDAGARAAAAGVQRWTIEFVTPTNFRRSGVILPLPSADLVMGSLLDRWNALAPLPFPDDLGQALRSQVAVSRFDLQSVAARGKGGVPQIGAVGRCSYRALSDAPLLRGAIETLLRFGGYSGVGAGTTRGFGMLRLVG